MYSCWKDYARNAASGKPSGDGCVCEGAALAPVGMRRLTLNRWNAHIFRLARCFCSGGGGGGGKEWRRGGGEDVGTETPKPGRTADPAGATD